MARMIEFYLDRTSGVATYLQLVHQVKQALRLGLLRPGDQLPTAKQAVAQLGINPNTVLKAYRELERALAGWVHQARAAGLTGEDMAALFDRALRESEEGVA